LTYDNIYAILINDVPFSRKYKVSMNILPRLIPVVFTEEQVRCIVARILAPFDRAWMWELGRLDLLLDVNQGRYPKNHDYAQGWLSAIEKTCAAHKLARVNAGYPAPAGRPNSWLYSLTG
jgi:hypothetical protein